MAIAIYNGPVFTCVCIGYLPFILLGVIVFGGYSKKAQFSKLEANTALGGFAEETLSALKLIVSFAQEKRAVDIYDQKASITRDIASDANRKAALVFGVIRTLIFGFFVFTFFVATIFVEKEVLNPVTDKPYNIEEIVSITQGMIMAMM
jgi:ABC-type multidrug transport system fused ATPase/permease subunit